MNARLQYNTVIYKFFPITNDYDKTILNAPIFVRSPKLSYIEPGLYSDGWRLRTLGVVGFFFWMFKPQRMIVFDIYLI